MGNELFGQFCALGAAISWAIALIFFKRSGESVTPLGLNLFKNCFAILLLGVTVLFCMDDFEAIRNLTGRKWFDLSIAGIVGIAIADTLLFAGLNRIGVGLMVVVDCLYSPFVILTSWLLLGEKIEAVHYLGGSLILAGVFISSGHKPPEGRTRGEIVFGMILAGIAVIMMAISIVYVKPIIEQISVMWATGIRITAGTIPLLIWAAISRHRKTYWALFTPSKSWKYMIPGALFGTYLSLVFWIAGFKNARAGLNAFLNQTSIVFALILATIFLREPLSKRKVLSVFLAFVGVAIITLSSNGVNEDSPEPPVVEAVATALPASSS